MINGAIIPWFWNVVRRPESRLRLFCFPYAGGSALIFRNWSKYMPELVEVYPIQLPGRVGRLHEKPYTNIESLVKAVGQAIAPYLDKPFALFGHSMGAIISYEVARYLRGQGAGEPAHLFVAGRRAPHIADDDPPTSMLPELEFIDHLRRLNGTPADVLEQPELMQLVLPSIRADFEMVETYAYIPGPLLGCPISAFGGLEDCEENRERLECWADHTTADFSLRMIPGGHFFLHSHETFLLRALVQKLTPSLTAAWA